MLKRLARFVLALIVCAYIALIVLALKSDSLIFQPHSSSYSDASLSASVSKATPRSTAPTPQIAHFNSDIETITAVYLPNPAARHTILFSHGNAEDIADELPFLNEFVNAGFSVFAYDYRGFGTSTGKPTEKGSYEDADAAYDYLTTQLHVPGNRVISMGRSLGCAMAIHLAANRPVAALVVEAPFLSAFRVLTHIQMLPWDKFNNAREIRKVHVPVLIIHGRADQVVPFWHGERLYALANQPKTFMPVDGAGHNDVILLAGHKYLVALQTFAAIPER